jgi:biotin synthase
MTAVAPSLQELRARKVIHMDTNLTLEEALSMLEAARDPRNAHALFQKASEIRNQKHGTRLWWSSGSGGIFPCMVKPRCSYCSFWTSRMFPADVLLKGLEIIEGLGIRQFHISGGTDMNGGFEEPLLELVRTIEARSGLKLEINLGPSFSLNTVLELKKLGIDSVTSSIECNAPELFNRVKPGDSLERRRELLRFCEEAEMPSRSMMLVGLGETDRDRVEHLLFMKQFRTLYSLNISRFLPYPGTLFENHPRCSTWDIALIVAMARILMPDIDIGLAAGNTADDIPLWYLSGGGNQQIGASIVRKEPAPVPDVDVYDIGEGAFVVDKRKQIQRVLEGMMLEITCVMPDKAVLKDTEVT